MMPRIGPKRRAAYYAIATACFGGVLALRLLGFTLPWDVDAKGYGDVAARILEEAVLPAGYGPPGIYYLYAGIFWLFGPKSEAVVATRLLLDLLTLGVLHAVVRRLYDRPTALVATVLYAVLSSGIALQRGLLQPEHPMSLLALLSLWCATRALDDRKGPWLLAAGLCAGLAATFTPTVMIMLAAPVTIAAMNAPAGGSPSVVARVAEGGGWFLAGGIPPAAALAWYCWSREAPSGPWLAMPFGGAQASASVSGGLWAEATLAARYFAEQWGVWLLAAAWTWLVLSEGADRFDGMLLGWLLGTVLSFAVLGSFHTRYFVPLTPAVSAAAGAGLVRLSRELGRIGTRFPSGRVVGGILVAAFVGIFVVKQVRVYSLVTAGGAARPPLAPIATTVEPTGGRHGHLLKAVKRVDPW